MIYSGIIFDTNGNRLKGGTGTVTKNGATIAIINTDDDGFWQIDMDTDGGLFDAGNKITFTAPGYGSQTVNAETVTQSFDVHLTKSNKLLLFAAAGIGLVIISGGNKKKRRVSGIENKDLVTAGLIAGGIVGVSLLYKACVKFGICSPADGLSNTSNNFWNPNFWQTVNPSGAPYNHPLTEDQAKALIAQIKDAFGLFNDNPEQVKAVFKSLYTQANASFLAWEFQKTDGADLLSYLRNGGGVLPWDGLGDKDILEINSYVNTLPKF